MSSRRAAFALGAFGALAVAWTWPLATHLSARVPHDLGDPLLNTWILWWNAHAVPFTARWWSPPILIPVRGALALSEHLAGLGLFSTPIQLLGGCRCWPTTSACCCRMRCPGGSRISSCCG